MPSTSILTKGFAKKSPICEVSHLLDDRVVPLGSETIDIRRADGRVLAEDVFSPTAVPRFDRSAMDGYALRCGETIATSPSRPLVLQVAGIAKPGASYTGTLRPCEAVAILTGAAIPAGADAVVRMEDVRERDG